MSEERATPDEHDEAGPPEPRRLRFREKLLLVLCTGAQLFFSEMMFWSRQPPREAHLPRAGRTLIMAP